MARTSRKVRPEELDDDTLRMFANNQHIERADRNGKPNTADAHSVEPAKTVNPNPGVLQPENMLNVAEISMMNRSDSSASMESGRSSRLGRLFKSKHQKNNDRADLPRGELEMTLRYAEATRKLVVVVLKARDILPFDKKGTCNPYVSVKLLTADGGREVDKKKTATVKGTFDPVYDNHFEFDVAPADFTNYRVQLSVKDDTNYGAFTARPVLGQIDIRLESLHEKQLPQQWLRLEPERK